MKNSIVSTIGTLLMLLALPLGLLNLLGQSVQLTSRLGLNGEMVRTTGVVTEITTVTDTDGGTNHFPLVLVTTENGSQFTAHMACLPFDCFSKLDVGMSVPIIYPRDDARESTVLADTFQGWASELLNLLLGCGLAAVGGFGITRLFARPASRPEVQRGGPTGSA